MDTTPRDISLYEILVRSANAGMAMQQEDGSLEGGENGPWGTTETPVRNTSHWAIVFKKAYEITGDEKYKQSATSAGEYLLTDECRPSGKTFKHFQKGEGQQANGLIGQAWTIEALKELESLTNDSKFVQEACEVFLLHKFDESTGLWHRMDVDGTELKKDPTFNHQLWFAASGGMIAEENKEIQRQIRIFLRELPKNMRVHPNGRIHHPLLPNFSLSDYVKYLAGGDRYLPLRNIRQKYWEITPNQEASYEKKEIGYHAFNLYGLAILKQEFPTHEVWQNETIQNALTYIQSREYQDNISENPYGYPYNPPGFEVPFAAHVFDIDNVNCEKWLRSQIKSHYDFEADLMSKNTPDSRTLAARIYEATRLPDIDIQL